ncbi:MAG: hypothetical protein N4J56_006243 [Chroococcidiopsis sp. SAG 2025]|uniref:hypothetical protein n=1 Tax=Chroococcidiopsis sp. SAG 2025 TaxID=171389 RepID=UPI002936D9C3|nr:hypothetical protein [Chroococcidiopsis sp. SAG 2025]MDV2996589.1 hypothetical protein [Chroococcidiopsis sp. SAG 2025]
MPIKFNRFSGILLTLGIIAGFQANAIAQPSNHTLADRFQQAMFTSNPDFFQNRSFGRQFDWLLGTNGFPDNEINRDAKRTDDLYRTALEQQVSSDPVIRTRDLPNPYGTSVLESKKSSNPN